MPEQASQPDCAACQGAAGEYGNAALRHAKPSDDLKMAALLFAGASATSLVLDPGVDLRSANTAPGL